MSRSNNTEIINPATRFFEWSGSEGKVKYYDKEAKENIYVDLPFTFLVLDTLVTITGYSDEAESGYWSNEVRNIKVEPMTVRTKKGAVAIGLYDEVKDLTGAKYTQSVYIAYRGDDDQLEIGNIKLHGSAIGPWIEFRKGRDIYQGAVTIAGKHKAKKGRNEYFEPIFEVTPTKEETDDTAKALDVVLQDYLKVYLARNANLVFPEPVAQEPEDDLIPQTTLGGSKVMAAGLAASAQNDARKRDKNGADDPFGEMGVPETEPAFDAELEIPF